MKFITIGLCLVLCLGLVACAAEDAATGDSGSPAAASAEESATTTGEVSATTAPVSGASKVGDVVRVGDLDLTILAFEPVDTKQWNQFNEATHRARVKAANVRGGGSSAYQFSPGLGFKIVDSAGVATEPKVCSGCPESMQTVGLTKDGTAEGFVYFQVAPNKQAKELWYQAFLSSNKATIALQ